MHDIHHCYDPRDGVSKHRALNHIPNTFNLPWLYKSAQWLERATRMALSVQKMQIFDKDFKGLFENNAAFNQ